MAGLLDEVKLKRVTDAWRRAIRVDPLLSRAVMPELIPLAEAFNNALTGDDSGQLSRVCDDLVRANLDATTVIRITTFLAETFTDETGNASGAVTKSLVSTLGHVCGLMMATMVGDANEGALRDPLTGLENRRAWNTSLTKLLLNTSENGAIAMIDLDGLKNINDTQGHEAGDAHLKKFAVDVSGAIPEKTRAYRFGGDEFGVISPNESSAALEAHLQTLSEKSGVARFSFGIAHTYQDGRDVTAFVKLADSRMYEMKKANKLGQTPA